MKKIIFIFAILTLSISPVIAEEESTDLTDFSFGEVCEETKPCEEETTEEKPKEKTATEPSTTIEESD